LRVLTELSRSKPRPSLIYLWSPTPDPTSRGGFERALGTQLKRKHELRWVPMRFDLDLDRATEGASEAVLVALGTQARAAHERGLRALSRLGIQVERLRSVPRVSLALPKLAGSDHEYVAVDEPPVVDRHAHVPSAEHLPPPK